MRTDIGKFVIVPLWILDAAPECLATVCGLLSFADQEGEAWPSHEAIAKRSHNSKRKVIDDITKLEELGIVKVERRFEDGRGKITNRYTLYLTTGAEKSTTPQVQNPLGGCTDFAHELYPLELEPSEYKNKNSKKTEIAPLPVGAESWERYLSYRKGKRLPCTQKALGAIIAELRKVPNPDQSLQEAIDRQWRGFRAEWCIRERVANGPSPSSAAPLPSKPWDGVL